MEAVRLGLVEVSLYLHEDGRLIGFSALGLATWDFNGTAISLWLLHYLGIHTNFRSQEGVPKPSRYGRRILGGVIEEIQRRGQLSLLGLFVDPENPARALYAEFGFREIDTWLDPEDNNRPWVRMLQKISHEPATPP